MRPLPSLKASTTATEGITVAAKSRDQELVQERMVALVLLRAGDQVLVLFSQQCDSHQA